MTLYKGRIGIEYGELMNRINRSLPVDIVLLPYDIATNRAWAKQLQKIGVLTQDELTAILGGLDKIASMNDNNEFDTLPNDEDVHSLVERLLTEMTGAAGAKIHTGRSRNDQVVCDVRMFTADCLLDLSEHLMTLIHTLTKLGRQHANTLCAGTTHMQPAQPITLGFFLLSLAQALHRDLGRLYDTYKRVNQSPLGAGAIAGSGFFVDRYALAEDLGFDSLCENAMDAISDRDFVQETVFDCASICCHLSRYAEQFIVWANPTFGYVRFSDTWSTGSSMMPQKRNPDAMELVRGKAARVIGNTTALLSLTKGLPLSYAKDLQEDKEPLFDALNTAQLCLAVFNEAIGSATFDEKAMAAALTGDLLATDLADALVKNAVPFRKAHERVANFVTDLESQSRALTDATPDELAAAFGEISENDYSDKFEDAVARRIVAGGTAPAAVLSHADSIDQSLDGIELGKKRI